MAGEFASSMVMIAIVVPLYFVNDLR